MISITPVILKHQKKSDGTYPVKIRVTYERRSKYLSTSIFAKQSELTTDLKIKSQSLNYKALTLVKELKDFLSGLSMTELARMSVDDVVKYLESMLAPPERFTLDFIQFGREQADKKPAKSRSGYYCALNSLQRFAGDGVTLDISSITVKFLRSFEEYLKTEPQMRKNPKTGEVYESKEKKGERAINAYLSAIGHIYNLARAEYNEPDTGVMRIPNNPFEYYKPPQPPAPKHRNIDASIIQKMIRTRKDETGISRFAVDVFLIGFGLLGMNVTDMYDCPPDENGVITYERNKTKDRRADRAEMKVRIEPCIEKILRDYRDGNGDRMFSFHQRYADHTYMTAAVNKGLKVWCAKHKVKPFTFYSSRHTFATIARSSKCGIDKYVVNECLNHVDEEMKVTDIYVEKDWTVLWNANRKVLSIFKWD